MMTSEEALANAAKMVEALATNSRGYQDGVKFNEKVGAVILLAAFLLTADKPK